MIHRILALFVASLFFIQATPTPTPLPTVQPFPTATRVPQVEREKFSGEQAYRFVAVQLSYGIRPTGSEGSRLLGDYILSTMKSYGWEVSEQPLTFDINGQPVKGRNLTGRIGIGKGPVIIFGAHYDTRLWSDNDPNPANRKLPTPGANDGGSGVAVLLELSRVLGSGYTFNNEIRLAYFDAEDNGNIPGWNLFSLGTYEYVTELDVTPAYVVIVDMVGDANLNIHYEGRSMQSAPEIMTGIWQVAKSLGYSSAFIPAQRFTMIDDHIPFIEAGIKAIDIIDFDYPQWHTVSDTLEFVSAESLGKVGHTLQVYLQQTGAIR
jgi:hypothetical protein